MRQFGVTLIPLMQRGENVEQQIPEGAVGVLAIVKVDQLAVEVHFHYEVSAPIMPLRFSTAQGPMSRYAGARHLASYEFAGQAWHVLVEDSDA